MKSHFTKLFFTACVLLSSVCVNARTSFSVDGIYYETLDDSTVRVIPGSTKYSGNIVIPSSVKYRGITYSVTELYNNSFFLCVDLKSIEIPSSVKTISYAAFQGCEALTSVKIPNGVSFIGTNAFADCKSLSSIEIPNSIKFVAIDAFNNTPWLSSQPDGVLYINNIAFKYKGAMPKNTTILLEDGTVSIGERVFMACTNLTSIEIPNSVTSIGERAFYNCTGLASITIPDGVKSIGKNAFWGCTGLASITIPPSVMSVDKSFYQCFGLKSVQWDAVDCNWARLPFLSCHKIESFVFGKDVKRIPNGCCYTLANLKSITIPSSVTTMGDSAFYGCTGLKSIEIPNSVRSIGSKAFYDCMELTSITIPNSVTLIEESTFSGCSGLTSIEIPNSVKSIGQSAFDDCASLKSIRFNGITPPKLDGEIFYNVNKSIPVYVPCQSFDAYKKLLPDFTNIQCFQVADPVDDPIDEPVVEPDSKSVYITWPVEECADKYVITITIGGNPFCTLTFDSKGLLLNIEYAAATPTTKSAPELNAETTVYGYKFNITGLTEGTEYGYIVNVLDVNDNVLKGYEGSFKTLGGVAVEENQADKTSIGDAVSIDGKTISVAGMDASDIHIYNTAGKQVSNPVPNAGVYVVTVGGEAVKVVVP